MSVVSFRISRSRDEDAHEWTSQLCLDFRDVLPSIGGLLLADLCDARTCDDVSDVRLFHILEVSRNFK